MARFGETAELAGRAKARRPHQAALDVTVVSIDGRPDAARGLATWLRGIAPARARGQVAVALVSDRRMRTLNRQYAGVGRVTDVLAFPASRDPVGWRPCGRLAARRSREAALLGDIVIARERAARQARAQGHSLATELRVLALHGLLHLLGWDHHVDGGHMARLEARLRRQGHLPEGLIERVTTT